MRSRVTLGDVARTAGVSKATASKVFTGRDDVARATADRVRDVAVELGYQPRQPRVTPTVPSVWVVVNDVQTRYAALVLDGILAQALDSDADVTVVRKGDPPPPGTRSVPGRRLAGSGAWMADAVHRGAQGFILVTTPVDAEHERVRRDLAVPVVALDPASHPPAGLMTIGATNWLGGREATRHLIGLGHTRIAFVGATAHSLPGDEREAGYHSALHEAGLSSRRGLVRAGTFTIADGLACRDLLAGPNRPTAVFAACDEVALGVIQAARELGLDVPRDLSVIGFDDTTATGSTVPALTTVRQPLRDMGRLAARTVIDLVRGTADVSAPVQLTTTLVRRDSTGPVPAVPR